MNKKIQKGHKPIALAEVPEAKQGTTHDPCTQHHQGAADSLSYVYPYPPGTSLLHTQGVRKGIGFLFLPGSLVL